MSWHTYCIPPVDFNWSFCKTVEETALEISKNNPVNISDEHCFQCPTREDFENDWNEAKRLARENHWDGDFARGPIVFWIPTHNTFCYGFAFKQDDDGATFVVSPVELPWLEE